MHYFVGSQHHKLWRDRLRPMGARQGRQPIEDQHNENCGTALHRENCKVAELVRVWCIVEGIRPKVSRLRLHVTTLRSSLAEFSANAELQTLRPRQVDRTPP